MESFVVENWLEHLRQHERVTHADEADQAVVRDFQTGAEPPRVRHLLAPSASTKPSRQERIKP